MTTNVPDTEVYFHPYGATYCAQIMVQSINLLANIYHKKGQLPCQQEILQDKCKKTMMYNSYTSKLKLDEEIKKIPTFLKKSVYDEEKKSMDEKLQALLNYKFGYIDIYKDKIKKISCLGGNNFFIHKLNTILKEPKTNTIILVDNYTSVPWSYLIKIDDILSEAIKLDPKKPEEGTCGLRDNAGGRKIRKTRKTRRRKKITKRKKTTKRRKVRKTKRTKK